MKNTLLVLAALMALGWGAGASAQVTPSPSTLTIDGDGAIRITSGVVTEVATDTVAVAVWNIAFSVRPTEETTVFAGRAGIIPFGEIVVGDVVDVLGALEPALPLSIAADVVNDQSKVPAVEEQVVEDRQSRFEGILDRVRTLFRR